MIDKATFNLIKEKHGRYASWAVWADAGERPKDNIGDLNMFKIEEDDSILSQLRPDVVLVGLNISSRPIEGRLGNFHDGRARYSQDYKLRHALKGTSLWGAYMTDIIKDFEQKASGKMMAYLRSNKAFEMNNVNLFKTELKDLGADQPTLVALGGDAFTVLTRNLGEQYDVWKLPHYSSYISRENYRKAIHSIIETQDYQPSV